MPDPPITPARLTKLVKEFCFLEENRRRVILGDSVRLNPENYLQLKAAGGYYSTDDDLYAKTWIAHPMNARRWIGFEVSDAHQVNEDDEVVTSLGFRLSDGTDQFYWDGADWTESEEEWNTEVEVATNISSFPVGGKNLQIVINLKTEDERYTPKLYSIKVLYESDINFQEDILYRSLVRKLKSEIRPLGRHAFTTTESLTTVQLLGKHKMDTPYNVQIVEGVFNHTDDSEHLNNLATTFNPSTGVIGLASTFPTGHVLWVDFRYEPEVAVSTSQDYIEVAKVPAMILESVNLLDCSELSQYASVINRGTGSGWKIFPPLRGSLEITMALLTDKGTDQQRLADEAKKFFMSNPELNSYGLDEDYRLWLLNEYQQAAGVDRSDTSTGRMTFRIVDVLYYLKEATEVHGVLNVVLNVDRQVS